MDYDATLGWLLGYWKGSIPIELVLHYENQNQKNVYTGNSYIDILHTLKNHPVIASDAETLRQKLNSAKEFKLEGTSYD